MIDTSNNIGLNANQSNEIYADRFIGPYARTQLNNLSWLNTSVEDGDEGLSQSDTRSNHLM